MKAMPGNSDETERKRSTGWGIFTALFYAVLVAYVGWVAWTQSAALAAPTDSDMYSSVVDAQIYDEDRDSG